MLAFMLLVYGGMPTTSSAKEDMMRQQRGLSHLLITPAGDTHEDEDETDVAARRYPQYSTGFASTEIGLKESIMHPHIGVREAMSIGPAGDMIEASHPENFSDTKHAEHKNRPQEQMKANQGIIVRQQSTVSNAMPINLAGEMIEASHPTNILDMNRVALKERGQEQSQADQEQRQADAEMPMHQEIGVQNLGSNTSKEVMETSDLLVEHAEQQNELRNTTWEAGEAVLHLQHETQGFSTNASLLEANTTRIEGSFRRLLNKRSGARQGDTTCKLEIFEHGDFNGRMVSLGPGDYSDLKDVGGWGRRRRRAGVDDRISSLKVIGQFCHAQLWENPNWGKASVKFGAGDVNKLGGGYTDADRRRNHWNKVEDKASSIKVTLNVPRRRRTRRRQATCSSITDAACGATKIRDDSQGKQQCAGDPCTGADQKCCKTRQKCAKISDMVCGGGKIKDVDKIDEFCKSDKCGGSDQNCCKDAESEDYYVSDGEDCPNPISEADECEEAAVELGGEWVEEEEWDDRCYGCIVDEGSKVSFNTDAAGKCGKDYDPVCRATCDMITSQDKCEADTCLWTGKTCHDIPVKSGSRSSLCSFSLMMVLSYIAWACSQQ